MGIETVVEDSRRRHRSLERRRNHGKWHLARRVKAWVHLQRSIGTPTAEIRGYGVAENIVALIFEVGDGVDDRLIKNQRSLASDHRFVVAKDAAQNALTKTGVPGKREPRRKIEIVR